MSGQSPRVSIIKILCRTMSAKYISKGTENYCPIVAYDHESNQVIMVVCAITASGETLGIDPHGCIQQPFAMTALPVH